MSFELLPGLAPYLVAFLVFAIAVAVVSVGVIGGYLVTNRSVRLARHESIPTYYRHALLAR